MGTKTNFVLLRKLTLFCYENICCFVTKTDFVVLRNRCSFVTITAVLVLRLLILLCYETDVVLLRQTESEHIPILDKLAKNSKKCLRTIVFAYVFRLGDVGATFHVLWC